MTSEIGRILKCLTSKSYHSLQDDAYTHVHLIPQGEVTDLNTDASDTIDERQSELIVNHHKNKIRRPRSAGDISETLHQCTTTIASVTSGGVSTFPGGPSGQVPEGNNVVSSSAFSRAIQSPTNGAPAGHIGGSESNNNNNNNNNDTSPSSNGSGNNSGGILSFFKFKSNNRHLERSACHQPQQHQDCGLVPGKGGAGSTAGTHSANNNNNKSNTTDLRYTKFPLSYGKNCGTVNSPLSSNNLTVGGGSSSNNAKSSNASTPSSSSSSALSSVNRHKSKLCRSLDSSQADSSTSCDASSISHSIGESVAIPPDSSPFEESQIQFTPQTRTYAHPHKSPLPQQNRPNTGSGSSSSSTGNFLTNTVSSIGRKVVNSVTPGSKNKNKSKLKVKSKSDNSLHRVNVDATNASVNSVLAAYGGITSGGVPRNASATTFTSYLDNQYQLEGSSSSQRRLNSVQLGDHATIRLPWTGFQQINNLSSVSSTRTFIPNTHNNNFEFSSITTASSSSSVANSGERYVECGSNILRTAAIPGVLSSNCGPRGASSSASSSCNSQSFVTRRRSRSLERCSNFRVFPINSGSSKSGTTISSSNVSHHIHQTHTPHSLSLREIESHSTGGSILSRSQSRKETGSEKEKQRTRSAHSTNSLERSTTHRVRHLLTPTEQEILLRNIDWSSANCVSQQQQQPHPEPPRRPDKPSKPSNIFQTTAFLADSSRGRKNSTKEQQRRPFEKLHRSAPNSSFSNSSESGESSYSAPPSPPPRPPSTLKPNSRLIIHHPSLTASALRQHQLHQSTTAGSLSPGSSGGSSNHSAGIINNMNAAPKRRPVTARSHGSSSDSGVSHISSSTVRGTSDFSDESAGSVNISQHSSNQNSSSVLSHSTTSSSGVSHQSSSAASNNSAVSSTPNTVVATAVAANTTTAPAGISLEDVRNSGFINKPLKGWLHSDQMLSKEGVTYTVRYIGCLDVNTSMKSLDFDTRSLIAKECINQVCEAAGLRSQDKKRKGDRRVARILGTRPRLEHAGSDVRLTITSTCLKLTSLDTGAVIAVHDMPNISFASGGDATMLDFVAYVAKDTIVGRACFVLECGSGLAQDVITTVGQAFELRFKEYLQKRPPPPRIPVDDPEYYNDLPGKVPPDVSGECKDKIQNVSSKSKTAASNRAKEPPPLNLHSTSDKELSVNLIDFEAPTPPAFGPSVEDKQLDSFLLPGSENTNGANNLGASGGNSNLVIGTGLGLPNSPSQPQPKDSFDMQPFAASLPQSIPAEVIIDQRRLLEGENWFHGTVSRSEAEELLKHDGDFLVRESMACPGQFVLTGLQGGSPKHLLLVDPEGVVRTKDRTFDNVIHLIKYHSDNCLPIISAESMVVLRNAVPRAISS